MNRLIEKLLELGLLVPSDLSDRYDGVTCLSCLDSKTQASSKKSGPAPVWPVDPPHPTPTTSLPLEQAVETPGIT